VRRTRRQKGLRAHIGFAIKRTAAAAEDVLVTYSAVNGTAVTGSDFVGVSGTATIAAGSTSATIRIDLRENR
jgi:hypothetical protein